MYNNKKYNGMLVNSDNRTHERVEAERQALRTESLNIVRQILERLISELSRKSHYGRKRVDKSLLIDGFSAVTLMVQAVSEELQKIPEDSEALTLNNLEQMQQFSGSIETLLAYLDDAVEQGAVMQQRLESGHSMISATMDFVQNLPAKTRQQQDDLGELSRVITGLVDKVSEIKGITQTANLLSINAATQAARAGDEGKGFMIIAQEMRSLSGKIRSISDEVDHGLDQVVGVMQLRFGKNLEASMAENEHQSRKLTAVMDDFSGLYQEFQAFNQNLIDKVSTQASSTRTVIADASAFETANYHDITRQKIERMQHFLGGLESLIKINPDADFTIVASEIEKATCGFLEEEKTHGRFNSLKSDRQQNGLVSIELF